MPDLYRLDGRKVIAEPSILAWAVWFEKADRHVGTWERDGIRVSTVFLGLDHSFCRGDVPVTFETMTFGDYGEVAIPDDVVAFDRYSTWEAAEKGHAEIVAGIEGWMDERVGATRSAGAVLRRGGGDGGPDRVVAPEGEQDPRGSPQALRRLRKDGGAGRGGAGDPSADVRDAADR